jgi:hypothetical protein
MESQLFPKSENPLHRCTRNSGVGPRTKDQPEVVKIVTETSWDVMRDDPVQSFREKVEDVRSRAKAEHENYSVVKLAVPEHAHVMVVCSPNWDMAECVLEV